MAHPIGNPATLSTKVCYGTQLTIHSQIQATLRTLGASDILLHISIAKMAVGNNFIAVITYDDTP
tara:strand:+ start:1952 stop:2146 length:195 start_codon:yes stop_codon:yes gene_type:complete